MLLSKSSAKHDGAPRPPNRGGSVNPITESNGCRYFASAENIHDAHA